MGPYAGKTPNYPQPNKTPIGNDEKYDTGLCREVRDRLRELGIEKVAGANLDFALYGMGDFSQEAIVRLVKWAEKRSAMPPKIKL